MPRPATGAPRWNARKGYWEARVTLLGQAARQLVPMPGIPQPDVERAKKMAKVVSDRMRVAGAVSLGSPETVNEWSARWLEERVVRGLSSVSDDRSRLSKWVLPKVGPAPMASVTRSQIEDLRDALDASVRNGELAWKTATHAWGLVTRMFADACGGKRRDLRVRDDNPTTNVQGPDRGVKKAKVYLYPAEFLALVSCERVPLRWRRMFALTTYLYARAGEVKALQWADVDFDRAIIHIHESVNRITRETKTTKSGTTRRIPIDPELLPLLLAMRDEAGGEGRLVPWSLADRKLSRQLQRCLQRAEVTRSDLYADDVSRKPMTFHDLRATGITWCAVRGDDPLKIKQRAGHRTFSTTEGYIREAENLGGNFGEVFPGLPPSLLKGSGRELGKWSANSTNARGKQWSRRESNPGPKTRYLMPLRA